MKIPLIAFVPLIASITTTASAAVYKCEEGGQLVFSDRPCGQNAEKLEIRERQKVKANSDSSEWRMARFDDDMTGTTSCAAVSPLILLGIESGEMMFASMRVVSEGDGFMVGVRSEAGINDRPESIHNNIDGLGLKVGEFPFHEFQIQSGSYVVGFKSEPSSEIVQELKEADSFRIRLRYWPYDQTYDSVGTTTTGFVRALEEMQDCDRQS